MVVKLEVVADHTLCACDECELRGQRDKNFVFSSPPTKEFNGLMIVGEGPGFQEVRYKKPFVGPSGRVLDELLKAAGIDRDSCFIANATSCFPAKDTKAGKGFTEAFPKAVHSCLPRLGREIELWRPRVILALGQAALAALTGEETEHAKRVPAPVCSLCGLDRQKKCPECDGKKNRINRFVSHATDWKISWVAGGIFKADELGLATFGVRYVVPTYHPSFLLHKSASVGKQVGGQFISESVIKHMEKAKRLLKEDPKWVVTPKITTSVSDVAAYTEEIGPEVAYAIDIETDAKDPADVTIIKCIGIHRFYWNKPEEHETLVVDTSAFTMSYPVMHVLRSFLQDSECYKVFQNGIYDTDVIERIWGFSVASFTEDTLVAHNAISPDEPHHLHHLAFTYTDASPWKPPKNKGGIDTWASDTDLFVYNARDTRATAYAMRTLRPQLKAEKVDRAYDADMQMLSLARRMRQTGVPISMSRRAERASSATLKMADTLLEMQKLSGISDFNPQSPAQLRETLFSVDGPFKLMPTSHTDKGAISADKAALLAYKTHPFVKALLEYREAKRFIGIMVEGMVPNAHGRVCVNWNPLGARTGRWTSSPNLQNLKHEDMTMFKPKEGRVIVGADFAQQQYRLLAAMAGDIDMCRLCMDADEGRKLEPDYDPHSYVARLAFGEGYTNLALKDATHQKSHSCKCETCARKSLRDLIKRVVYGMFFGGGAQTIRDSIAGSPDYEGPPLSIDTVQGVLDAFFKAFKRVRPFQQECYAKALETYEVRDPVLGRRRIFPFGEVDYTIATNFPIQAGDAAIMTLGVIDLLPQLPKIDPSAEVLAIIHDAIYVECTEEAAERIGKAIEQSLTCEMSFVDGVPPMLFSAVSHSGEDWGSV